MYLQKCWRDARLSVLIYAVPMVLSIIFLLWALRGHFKGGTGFLAAEATVLIGLASFLIPLVAWTMGGEGIGRDISEGTGAFLLTRPRRRRFFVWADGAFALGLMAAMAAMTSLLYLLACIPQTLTSNADGRFEISPSFWILVPLSSVVFGGLVYGVTYLCTMLIPQHATARVVSVVLMIAYAFLHFRSKHWSGLWQHAFPSWSLVPSAFSGRSMGDPHLWIEFVTRGLAIILLLLAAQFVLERREIRA